MVTNYYQQKTGTYFTNARYDLMSTLGDSRDLKVLEAGAGGGDTLLAMKNSGLASEVAGLELFELPGTNQGDPLIDKFIICDVERDELDLPLNHYDAIMCGDVLEHLIDPWKAVEKLARHLKPGGLMIASIPNIRALSAFRKIFLRGDFSYTNQGLFDRTHYRFFCRRNMIDLLTSTSRQLVSVTSNLEFKKKSGTKTFNRLTGRIFEHFFTVQFIVVVRKLA